MNRSRREIKVPKRFDDEPFVTSRRDSKPLPPPPPQPPTVTNVAIASSAPAPVPASSPATTPTQTPTSTPTPTPTSTLISEPIQSKSIIKIKLNKKKPRDLTPIHVPPPPPPPPAPPIIKPKKENVTPKPPTPAKKRRPRTPPVFTDIIPNVVLPFWDARTAAEDHEDDNVKELVHCQCGIGEELGLMVQCETCLTWQHAHCLGIERPEDAPDGYTCQACSDPRFSRDSMRWAYDQDWLLKGRMKQFSCNRKPEEGKNVELLHQINRLIDDALKIYQLMHSLRVKSRLLANANDDDPELRLFRVHWPANYQHSDGTAFMPTIHHLPNTPTSRMSAMVETPDPGDIPVETVAQATLPEIGQLLDVSAILDNTDLPGTSIQPNEANHEVTSNDCRSNLRLHIQQTEEFVNIEIALIERRLASIEKQCALRHNCPQNKMSFESLKNDLFVMASYIAKTKKLESRGTDGSGC